MANGANFADRNDFEGNRVVRPSDLILATGDRVPTRVLIVEDDLVDQAITERNLQRSRFMDTRSICVATLRAAQTELVENAFDFVIMDFWIRGVSSLPLLDLIARQGGRVVPILVTSIDFTDVQGLGLSFGAMGHLHKSDLPASALDSVMRIGMAQLERVAGQHGTI